MTGSMRDGEKNKNKGSRVWRFISSPHTIKEVCTTPTLYLTKTEREQRRKIVLASIGATVFFFFQPSLFFLKWRLGKKMSIRRSGRNTKKGLHQLTGRRRECEFTTRKTKEQGTEREKEKEKESMIEKNLDERSLARITNYTFLSL